MSNMLDNPDEEHRSNILARIFANDSILIDINLNLSRRSGVDDYISDIISGLYHNTNLKWLEFGGIHINDTHIKSIINMLQFNTTIISITSCECFNDKIRDYLKPNRKINYFISKSPLGDGTTDAGDFDALPNEILCQITIQLWNTSPKTAFEFANACKRARDCVYSDWTAQNYLGLDMQYNMRHLFRTLV